MMKIPSQSFPCLAREFLVAL